MFSPGGWEEELLELVQMRVDETWSEEPEAPSPPAGGSVAPLPPPPSWGQEKTYEDLVDDAMQSMLQKRYAEARDAYERALELQPDGPSTSIIRANLTRLRQLLESE